MKEGETIYKSRGFFFIFVSSFPLDDFFKQESKMKGYICAILLIMCEVAHSSLPSTQLRGTLHNSPIRRFAEGKTLLHPDVAKQCVE